MGATGYSFKLLFTTCLIYNKENDVFYPGFAFDLKKRVSNFN